MPELLTERTVLTLIAALGVLGMFVMLCRSRRVSTSMEDATLAALHRVTSAAPYLRSGLNQESADKTAPYLRELLSCAAVGVVDADGTLLTWDGEANHHYDDVTTPIERVLRSGKREYVDHSDVPCDQRPCPMRHAVVVPLEVEGRNRGALVVITGGDQKRLLRAAEELADHVSAQLELAELQESKEKLARAEVRALRAQISPHFIYNALNTISSHVRTDPEQARELLQEFADFTRYSFRTTGLYTTLAEELRNIDRYLMLEGARFGPERLKVQLRIDPEVLPVTLPFLALQPLVENAVRHGLLSKPGGGTVSVVAADHGNEALISVDDDGVGMDPRALESELGESHLTGAHVGLGNINDRMRATFGNDYGLVVETEQGAGMKVIMRVPKFAPGVHPIPPEPLPDGSAQDADLDVPEQEPTPVR
ncbi:two-component system LytT family sensor kinase [Halopolyspora algeriensis]|uniref:Two-component system LytT family sensor kinase n=1 Tax=Halopolyspora algeriensis TaxID=1500506 RepID=A0A368W250_9ACTN|nr:histidine kinase [Halopolyspora algeriensis]RCW47284.1 two-component system LytT family sensor kinase [Halopolyspora algeriensis]TQM42519.1 two-component system LytT family sensor kinase [Halopolyspora algeriensis]